MNKKNIRTSFIIVIAVSIWMLLGLFAPTKNESVTYVPQKQTVLTSYSVAKELPPLRCDAAFAIAKNKEASLLESPSKSP